MGSGRQISDNLPGSWLPMTCWPPPYCTTTLLSFALTELDVGNTLVLPARVVGCSQLPAQTETDMVSEEVGLLPSLYSPGWLCDVHSRCRYGKLAVWRVFCCLGVVRMGSFHLPSWGQKTVPWEGGVGVVPPLPHNTHNFFLIIFLWNLTSNLISFCQDEFESGRIRV